ncbi:hypothetical protein WN944_005816 [Citrus x changshan-huyou]|uniref:ATP-dependent Clp protease proteolytic subunit n=1 Tax=Citrus x changshan-huyou TaxID=2935761 RepID=A0AAP0MMV5_9ROSI
MLPSKCFLCWNAMKIANTSELKYQQHVISPNERLSNEEIVTYDYSLTMNNKGLPCSSGQVIPFTSGTAWEQPPPDLASYLYKNRIVYLGMSFVPSVTELILAEFIYPQYEDAEKPIYLYINSTETTKGGQKLGYETEAFAIYDVMG